MYARWKSDDEYSPLLGAEKPPSSRIELLPSPTLDLESQLNAELDGASWAVIAFAPEDALWADWLYRNLNGYPVAAPIIKLPTVHGLPRPDCLSIFPDRRDPHHAAHYPQALEKSGYLVVVCSPRSAHCPEADAQICAFKKAGGEERIIALVVESEPEGVLEKMPKTAAPEWLPAWLRWRLSGDAFAEADSSEPRIVDARPGRASLKEVRDILLGTLLTVHAWELEVLGALMRPVETLPAVPKPVVIARAVAAPPPVVAAPPRKVGPVVLTTAICVSVTLGIAWWSFGRVENDKTRALAAPVQILAPKIAKHLSEAPAEALPAEVPAPVVEAPAPPVVASVPPAAPPPAQIIVPPVSSIPPLAVESAGPAEAPPARALMIALHHRGDAAVGERQLDEALGFYEEAMESARATTPHGTAAVRAEAAILCRKLGTLQLQMASTSEARASFVQGRKILLQLKKQGAWNAERAKVLAEIEASLRRLPRD